MLRDRLRSALTRRKPELSPAEGIKQLQRLGIRAEDLDMEALDDGLRTAQLEALLLAWYDASIPRSAQSDADRWLRRETEAALGLPRGPR